MFSKKNIIFPKFVHVEGNDLKSVEKSIFDTASDNKYEEHRFLSAKLVCSKTKYPITIKQS